MPYERLLAGRWSDAGRPYFVTTSTYRRRPHFRAFELAAIVAREIHATAAAGRWQVIAWVVMPDHVHLLVALRAGALPTAIGRLKGRTSRLIGLVRPAIGRVWQGGYHDHAVRREEDLVGLARYLCANPLRAGLVSHLRDYPFWDACWWTKKRQAEA
jgi:REP element-mobilizing transposase RayT